MITPAHLILLDTLIEQIFTINQRIQKIKAMSEGEVNDKLAMENERTKDLKALLEADG